MCHLGKGRLICPSFCIRQNHSYRSVLKASEMGADRLSTLLKVFGGLKEKVLWKWETGDYNVSMTWNIMVKSAASSQHFNGKLPGCSLCIMQGVLKVLGLVFLCR